MTKRPISLPDNTMLRPPVSHEDGERRVELIQRAIRLRQDIELDINTVRYWNEHVRRPGEAEIDPDPHGEYAEMLRYLTKLIDGAVS